LHLHPPFQGKSFDLSNPPNYKSESFERDFLKKFFFDVLFAFLILPITDRGVLNETFFKIKMEEFCIYKEEIQIF